MKRNIITDFNETNFENENLAEFDNHNQSLFSEIDLKIEIKPL